MGKSWFDRSKTAAEFFRTAEKILSEPISELCFNGPDDVLNRTDYAQVTIYVTSVACYQGLRESGGLDDVVACAGLSLGEFTALHLAGAYDFETGLRLVRLRGQAMQEAAEAVPSGMVALIGADEPQATEFCRKVLGQLARNDEVLVPANLNCSGQVVISGTKEACELAEKIAGEAGFQAKSLAVAGAFHSPLMKPAAERLSQALDTVIWQTPRIPVLSNVTGLPHKVTNIQSIKERLVEQLTSPVRWSKSMEWAIANLPDGRFVELAPNKILTGLMRRIDRKKRVDNLSEPQG
jgi:[acyl-carrier-protein] S-malonyltransferase